LESRGSLSPADIQILNKAHALKTEILIELGAKNYNLNWSGFLQLVNIGCHIGEWVDKHTG
jgi:hypothetical protein